MFKFIEWKEPITFSRPAPRLFYHRLANAGRLQFFSLVLMWPLPWADAVRDLPGYGFDRPSGIRSALGWSQKSKP